MATSQLVNSEILGDFTEAELEKLQSEKGNSWHLLRYFGVQGCRILCPGDPCTFLPTLLPLMTQNILNMFKFLQISETGLSSLLVN